MSRGYNKSRFCHTPTFQCQEGPRNGTDRDTLAQLSPQDIWGQGTALGDKGDTQVPQTAQ